MKKDHSNPFATPEGKGYLNNKLGLTDPVAIKRVEHGAFVAHLDTAIDYLKRQNQISYESFLETHRILFSDFYPWAGSDRSITAPNREVFKGQGVWKTVFCEPPDMESAIEEGLRIAEKGGYRGIKDRPGHVMGMFAFAHPFLDGNGRTIILLHSELMSRAKCHIDWKSINKNDYLRALTREIDNPANNALDTYLSPFIIKENPPQNWMHSLGMLKGLDGSSAGALSASKFSESIDDKTDDGDSLNITDDDKSP